MTTQRKHRGAGEGSIYPQPARDRWVAALTLPDGKRRYLYAKTRKDVAEKLNACLRDMAQGLPLPGDKLTLEAYLNDWLINTVAPGRSAGTHLLYSQVIRLHIIPAIGKTPLAKVSPQHVQTLQSALLAKKLGVKRIPSSARVYRLRSLRRRNGASCCETRSRWSNPHAKRMMNPSR